VTPPCLGFSRGHPPKADKLLGTLSLVRFFGVSKEMNVNFFNFLDFGFRRNDNKKLC
jgi:hypothetical protein